VSRRPEPALVQRVLNRDRTWSAYALADLDPRYAEGTSWLADDDAAVLLFRGLEPPVLFATGDPQQTASLLADLPPGPIQFTLQATHRALLKDRLLADKEIKMWRMVLDPEAFPGLESQACQPLGPADLPAVEALMADHLDRPDGFASFQLADGTFFGIWHADRLLAMAGTHVISESMGVAALGNVFTAPEARGQGLGRAVSAAATANLVALGLPTIVLNVSMQNEVACNLYRHLGYRPYCGYYEGIGRLLARPQ